MAGVIRSAAAVQEARARVRGDGGPLYVVTATNPAGKRVAMDGVAEIDARGFALEFRLNGWTDIDTERVR